MLTDIVLGRVGGSVEAILGVLAGCTRLMVLAFAYDVYVFGAAVVHTELDDGIHQIP